jgi:HSP20 family protein
MEESGKKNWLYGVIVLLLLALVTETGFLISKWSGKSEEKKKRIPAIQPYPYTAPAATPSRLRPLFDEAWDPFEEMRAMQERVNRIFDEGFGHALRNPGFSAGADFSPAIDLQETKEAYVAKADLPGLEKDKIQVSVSGNVLTLQGERRAESEKEDTEHGFYAGERSYGSFSRTLTLPGLVDESQITADYENGVLTVTLPKLPESEPSKKQVQIT